MIYAFVYNIFKHAHRTLYAGKYMQIYANICKDSWITHTQTHNVTQTHTQRCAYTCFAHPMYANCMWKMQYMHILYMCKYMQCPLCWCCSSAGRPILSKLPKAGPALGSFSSRAVPAVSLETVENSYLTLSFKTVSGCLGPYKAIFCIDYLVFITV